MTTVTMKRNNKAKDISVRKLKRNKTMLPTSTYSNAELIIKAQSMKEDDCASDEIFIVIVSE